MVDLAKSAIWYARHGWTVFPLRPRTKEPFKDLGVYSATTDTDQIMDWWREHPRANIGLHCGGCNLLAIDMDSYKDEFSGGGICARRI
jgi:putative DNA primase/helicase